MRSGLRWLVEDGAVCRAGEPIAYCNIGLNAPASAEGRAAFADEYRDLQLALAPVVGGRVRRLDAASGGGFLDRMAFHQWSAGTVFAEIETEAEVAPEALDQLGRARLQLMAGRRFNILAEDRAGPLSGWFHRKRAWLPAAGGGGMATLLAVGVCDASPVVKGTADAFFELLTAVEGPAHVIHFQDSPVVLSARALVEQAARTPDDNARIADDMRRALADGAFTSPQDWVFAGAILAGLQASPLTERCELLGSTGVTLAEAPHAVLLSANSEARTVLRHRRLGYTMHLHGYRFVDAGPRLQAWMRQDFEPVRRSFDDMRADYETLIGRLRDPSLGRPDTAVLIFNVMSSNGYEDLQRYDAFDEPIARTVSSVDAKETNLMLDDLARQHDVSIVDLDLIAATMGAYRHLPDRIHASGPLQSELRAEVLRILRHRRVPGFGPSGFS